MDLLLGEEAGRAQDIADILSAVRTADKDHVQDITLAITGLNNLSWALRELNDQIDAVQRVISRAFADDLALLQNSVAFTLQDVWTLLGKIPRDPTARDYRHAWKDLARYCQDMDKQTLHMRLETYTLFVFTLCKVLKRQAYSKRQIEELRDQIYDLETRQRDNRRITSAAEAFSSLSMVPVQRSVLKQTQAHERESHERLRPAARPSAMRPRSRASSCDSDEVLVKPGAPSPPAQSTTATFSSTSQNSSGDAEHGHWATKIFNHLPATMLDEDSRPSRCYGETLGKGSHALPEPEFDRILQIKFPDDLRTKFFWRPRDYRCKIVCEWHDGPRGTRRCCLPLSELHLRRSEALLYLCFPTVEASSTCWASLKFTSYEWLVVFHCTFLSLRSHDNSRRVSNELDHCIKGETSHFAGAIRDSGFKHALRVYRDKATNGVRLEASVLGKEMQHCPIWTAFITHSVTSPTWYRRSRNTSTVYLAELRRHVFSSTYSPHVAANGEHFLDFDVKQDAEDFVKVIDKFGAEFRGTKRTK